MLRSDRAKETAFRIGFALLCLLGVADVSGDYLFSFILTLTM